MDLVVSAWPVGLRQAGYFEELQEPLPGSSRHGLQGVGAPKSAGRGQVILPCQHASQIRSFKGDIQGQGALLG